MVFAGSSSAVPAQPSIVCYPGQASGAYVGAVTFPVYDTAGATSRVMFARVCTSGVVLDTIESVNNLRDSLPSISVFKGWNLLGYVQWGRPTAPFFAPSLAADYLANIMTPIPGVGQGVQALVKYNAVTGVYEAVQSWDPMELGKGYWLASDVDGTIVPAQW